MDTEFSGRLTFFLRVPILLAGAGKYSVHEVAHYHDPTTHEGEGQGIKALFSMRMLI